MSIVKIAGRLLLGASLLLASNLLRAESAVSHIFLVQNSGWMLPFYDDPNSKLKELALELSKRLGKYGSSEQVLASFNQSVGTNLSPSLAYRGSDPAGFQSALQAIALARKPGSQAYADTDFKQAIVGAITQFSPGKPCLLWIITNNKNSPDNSPATIEKNKDFYKFLQETKEIKRIIAFPHAMEVQSSSRKDYRANGLMIYALAYGEQANDLLQQMLEQNAPFGKTSARLKPLDAEALTFVPQGVKNNKVRAQLAADKKTLVLSFSADGKPEVAELIGQFRNDFYPYDIRAANVVIDTDGFHGAGREKIQAELSTKHVGNIPAGGVSQDISVRIKVPAIPSPWDLSVIFSNGYTSRGVIRFQLEEQKLAIANGFTKSMEQLFPQDPLPDLFIPGKSAEKSTTRQKMIIQVEYPIWPLLVLSALVCLLFGGGIGAFLLLRREKIFRVSIDGVQKTYGLKPFAEAVIKDLQGNRIGLVKRGFSGTSIVLDKNKTNTVRIM